MRSERKHNTLSLSGDRPTKDIFSYVGMMVDIYYCLFREHLEHLAPKERDYFITAVIAYNSGIKDIHHHNAVSIYIKNVGIPDNDGTKSYINDYLNRIARKKWIIKNRSSYEIPQFFKGINLEKDVFSIDLAIRYEINR